MDSDDFLWQCAFTDDVSSMQSLVPNLQHELNPCCEYKSKTCWTNLPHKTFDNSYDLELSVFEIKGNGVLDSVSGEVWEACLLLSAYILIHPNLFVFDSVLELGSGVGLPGLLVAELHSLVKSSKHREMVLSDNDPSCLESLQQLIQEHGNNSKEYFDDDYLKEIDGNICDNVLSVIDLDWNAYAPFKGGHSGSRTGVSDNDRSITDPNCINGNNHIDTNEVSSNNSSSSSSFSEAAEDNIEPMGGRFKVLMGSALCYDDSHICLADTLKYFLDGSCEEVIIIQIGDRAGFGLMLTRLSNLDINYTIEVVSEEIYNMAQQIGQKQNSLYSAGADYTSYDEGEIRLEKTFQFNSNVIQSAIDRCATEEANPSTSTQLGPIDSCFPQKIATVLIADSHTAITPIYSSNILECISGSSSSILKGSKVSGASNAGISPPTIRAPRTNLIKTNRESFVILRIIAI
mmetsp:Transcript_35669/g.33811  ORF Transcript_35669/g.33811 Transcript_35669/m.33811 type:complete len:460 (-) Transcript_35669:80-1459(-)